MIKNTNTNSHLKIKVLNIRKHEIFRDLDRAIDFDQSDLFKKIYDTNKTEIRSDVPYFHFVPSTSIWTDYIKGIYK